MSGFKSLLLYIVVFICGMSTMGVELSASRLLAPFFFFFFFVWTNIIGIILISLSIGYYFGGKFADKHPHDHLFYMFSLTAGLLIGIIPFLASLILPFATQALSTATFNDFLLSFVGSLLLFAFPAAFLGAIVPFAIRINSQKIDQIGKTSGNIYALSTVGSIIGVYLPALVLIPTIGTRFTIAFFAIILIIFSLIALFITLSKKKILKKKLFIIVITACVLISVLFVPRSISSSDIVIYEAESAYCFLQVKKTETALYLVGDRGIWSKKLDGNIFTERYWDYFLVSSAFTNHTDQILIVGLAAGTTAQSYSAAFPEVNIDGVEIDPLVVEIGKKYFNMTMSNLNIILSDGRLYVKTTQNKYDIVALDVYRDILPYHMITVEFFDEIKSILKPGGVLSINIAKLTNSNILDIISNTLLQVFPKVYKVNVPSSNNYLLFATTEKNSLDNIKTSILDTRDKIPFSASCSKNDALTLKIVFTEAYTRIDECYPTNHGILTDDHNPIEQLYGLRAFYPFL